LFEIAQRDFSFVTSAAGSWTLSGEPLACYDLISKKGFEIAFMSPDAATRRPVRSLR